MKTAPMGERAVPEQQIIAMKRAHAVPGYDKMNESEKKRNKEVREYKKKNKSNLKD
jgi:hypothetical protein